MTNYERIKAMSIDELSTFIHEISNCEMNDCCMCPLRGSVCTESGVTEWLESEVEEK